MPNRIKEWAYAGFAFDFIFACISHWAVDGFYGQVKPKVKTGDIIKWLKEDFELGHGHAMAIYALLKRTKNEQSK